MSLGRVSFVQYVKGHKNSKGESAPWVIKKHETGEILSSHATEAEAKRHLQQMHIHKGSIKSQWLKIKAYEGVIPTDDKEAARLESWNIQKRKLDPLMEEWVKWSDFIERYRRSQQQQEMRGPTWQPHMTPRVMEEISNDYDKIYDIEKRLRLAARYYDSFQEEALRKELDAIKTIAETLRNW